MDDTLAVVTNGLESIKKWGWCNIWKGHKDAIAIIKNTIMQCGREFSFHEHDSSIQIFLKGKPL